MAVKVQVRTEAETKALERYQAELDAMRKKVTTSSKSVDEFTKEMRKLDSQQRQLNKLTGETTGKVGGMKDMFGGFVITAGDVWNAAKRIGTEIWSLAKAGAEAEQATRTLQFAVERAGYSWEANSVALDKNIQRISWLAAVDDEDLAVAQSKLIRSTGDLTESQEMLGLATDIAAVTGKELEAVVKALSQAHGGQYGALKKLGVAIDSNMSSTEAMQTLYEQFGGAAGFVNDNMASDAKRLGIAWGNLKEAAGQLVDEPLGNYLSDVAMQLQVLGSDSLTASEKFDAMNGSGLTAVEYTEKLKDVLGLTDDNMRAMTSSTYEQITAATELTRVQDELNGAYDTAEGSAIALARAENRLEDANKKVADMQARGETKTREYEDAVLDARQAALDFKGAQDKAADNDATLAALERERVALQKLADAARASGRLLLGVNTQVGSSGYGGRILMADGGIIAPTPGGVPVTAAEAGVPEAFIPLERTPRSLALLSEAARRIGAGMGGSTTVINVSANSAADIPAIRAAVYEVFTSTVRNATMLGRP